jgi:hypothetical protein
VALLLVISCLKQKAKLPSNSLALYLSLYVSLSLSLCGTHKQYTASQPFAGYQLVKEHKKEGKVSEYTLQRIEIFTRLKRVLKFLLIQVESQTWNSAAS